MKLRLPWHPVAWLLLPLILSACGSNPTPVPTPTIKPTLPATPSPLPTPLLPTAVPTEIPPTATPPPPTATPVPPQATSKQQVNVRQGPGVQFPIAGKMTNNASALIIGKSEDGKWFQIAFPDAAHPSWVAGAFVNVTGPVEQLPVVAVAPPATLTPTQPPVAARTRTPAATATAAVPAARGILSFVSYDASSQSYSLNNLRLDSRNIAGFNLMGISPADISPLATNAAPFAWSPDGGKVVYVFSPSRTKNVLRLFDQAGNSKDLFSHDAISSPTWAPDGQTIAYVAMDNGSETLQTISVAGGTPSRFFKDPTRGPETYRGLAWGKQWLLFASNNSGSSEIWRANMDGSGPLQLTMDKRENSSPAWSPDWSQFAYTSKQTDGSYQIMVANADGSNPRKLTNAGNNFTPTWAPDGNWIAFSSTRGGRLDIYVMDKYGGAVQALTDKFGESQLPGSWR